jgi:hypothetical protein
LAVDGVFLFAPEEKGFILKGLPLTEFALDAKPPVGRLEGGLSQVVVQAVDRLVDDQTGLALGVLAVVAQQVGSHLAEAVVEVLGSFLFGHNAPHHTIFTQVKVTLFTLIAFHSCCLIEILDPSVAA